MPDDRAGDTRTAAEVEAAIRDRKVKTFGGALAGVAGVLVGSVAALVLHDFKTAVLGFVVACIGFGYMHPNEVARFFGRA